MGLTVGELLTALRDVPPDCLVILAHDGEGNGFSPVAQVETDAAYEAHSTWSGDVKLRVLTPEDEAQGYGPDDVGGEQAVPCVCLWPTN